MRNVRETMWWDAQVPARCCRGAGSRRPDQQGWGSGNGQAAGVRAPDARGARHPLRTAVVHRRARLPQVRRRGPGRAGAGLRRGHRLRRLGHRGLRPGVRVRHDRQAGPAHLPDPAVARGGPRHRPDVLRHPHAGRLAVLRRPALRAQARPRQGLRPGLHLLHPPRDRVLPAEGQAARRHAARPRPTTPATSTTPRRTSAWTSAARRSPCWSRWASRSSSATTRAPPASRRSTCATPTRSPPPTTS